MESLKDVKISLFVEVNINCQIPCTESQQVKYYGWIFKEFGTYPANFHAVQ